MQLWKLCFPHFDHLRADFLRVFGAVLQVKDAYPAIVSLLDEQQLDLRTLCMFQLKDFCCSNRSRSTQVQKNLSSVEFTQEDVIEARKIRLDSLFFPNAKLLKAGYELIDDEIKRMRD